MTKFCRLSDSTIPSTHGCVHALKYCAHMSHNTRFIAACYDYMFYSEKQLPRTRLSKCHILMPSVQLMHKKSYKVQKHCIF